MAAKIYLYVVQLEIRQLAKTKDQTEERPGRVVFLFLHFDSAQCKLLRIKLNFSWEKRGLRFYFWTGELAADFFASFW